MSAEAIASQPDSEQPEPGYLKFKQLKTGVSAIKEYARKSKLEGKPGDRKKNLLDAGDEDPFGSSRVICEVVFKNIPDNTRTFIHNITLPYHWRLQQEPEDCQVAIFVRHRRGDTEAQRIQFARDRDLDIDNTHSYYKELFAKKLDEGLRSRISRIISTKELATEFNTFQKLDRLAKTYDLFLSDKQLMMNKMNPLPRRLGRRFWVREKKVPIMVKLDASNLKDRITNALSVEPFYVLGRSATEKLQIGLLSQDEDELVKNLEAFLKKLFQFYSNKVKFIRLRTDWGIAMPLYADLIT